LEVGVTSFADIEQQLTGPGGPFEVTIEQRDGQPMTLFKERLPDLRTILDFARAHDAKDFIVYGERRISFADFVDEVAHVADGLRSAGVSKGDRVAVLSQNNPEWCATFWATVSLGAVLVGLNGWWKNDEIIYGLEDSGAKVLVADRKRFERIADSLSAINNLERTFVIDLADGSDQTGDARVDDFATLRSGSDVPPLPTDELHEDDEAVIFYTSGTTGRPKGAISTHANMIANLQNTVFLTVASSILQPADESLPAPAQPSALFTSPLFHVSGCHSTLVVGMMGGLKLVMLEGKFEPEKAFELIEHEQVAVWATVPTMIWRACEWEGRHSFDTSSVVTVSFGGSPSADELQRRIRETFPSTRSTNNAYGLTESSSVATILTGDDALSKADSVGRPMPTVDIAIAGADGAHLAPGETGEVLIRGPIIMKGYWNKPEATAETLRDGWLWTGDVGHLDDDGYLFITDRAKDMLIRGGENIYCVEIENRLVEHDSIADAAIVGVPHPELGEEVKAVLEIDPSVELPDDEIRAWVREVLAEFKVPTHIERWDGKLPRNASGKLLKNALRGTGEVSFQETM
jgi:long-chain acyl-CoA synthetase